MWMNLQGDGSPPNYLGLLARQISLLANVQLVYIFNYIDLSAKHNLRQWGNNSARIEDLGRSPQANLVLWLNYVACIP